MLKKSREIKIYTDALKSLRFSVAVAALSLVELAVTFFLCPTRLWLGFACGVGAFGASFAGMEVVSRRVFSLGSVKQGVMGGVFWVCFKFFVPLLVIYYGCLRGFSILGIFCGFLVGLVNVSVVLFVAK